MIGAYFYGTVFYPVTEQESVMVKVEPFTHPLILSLDTPVKDKQGIPYVGIVSYNPVDESYSYIATADKGSIIPLGSSAFSPRAQYLAIRSNASSSDLVVYNSDKFAVERVVQNLQRGEMVPFSAWNSTGDEFVYMAVGASNAMELRVENLDENITAKILQPNFPIGFSPDSKKLLLRGTPALAILNIVDGVRTPITGTAFVDSSTKFILSPTGDYIVTVSDTLIEWYKIDWDYNQINSLGRTVITPDVVDVAFATDDTLLVRDNGKEQVRLYTYNVAQGVTLSSVASLPLPADSHILYIKP
jgi:hypothetical protein